MQAGLTGLLPEAPDFRRGGIRTACAVMQKSSTPRVLIVDITGEDQPLKALGELASVVEPDVCVLVIGERDSTDFYREVTRGLGAADYLAKPLTRENVARHFGGLVMGRAPSSDSVLGGRVLTVTGVRGGVGGEGGGPEAGQNFDVLADNGGRKTVQAGSSRARDRGDHSRRGGKGRCGAEVRAKSNATRIAAFVRSLRLQVRLMRYARTSTVMPSSQR